MSRGGGGPELALILVCFVGGIAFTIWSWLDNAKYAEACDRAGGKVVQINGYTRCVKRPIEIEIEVRP